MPACTFDRPRLLELLEMLRADEAHGRDAAMDRVKRRAEGVFFTPAALVDFVVGHVLDGLGDIPWDSAGVPQLRMLDPAAGDGRFLFALADQLRRRSPNPSVLISDILACCIALENDRGLAELAAERLVGADVRCCEALLGAGEIPPIDVVVGNPPYVRSLRADSTLREQLRGRLAATSHGEWDLYTAFIEQSYRWLSPRGQLGLVVPSRWLTAQSARGLRTLLSQSAAVRGVLDFGSEQIFSGATTYVSALFLGAERQSTFGVARLGNGGQGAAKATDFEVGSVSNASVGSEPWQVSVGQGRDVLQTMQLAGPPLGEIARIIKGAGTNADRVYVLGADSDVEAALIRPCIRGRDVGKNNGTRCLVPYDSDGRLIEPDALRRQFPKAMAHLESNREILEARERGRFRGDRFYQFGRPQNMETLLSNRPKIVVPDVTREGRAMLDTDGSMVLDSAYAVIPHREEDFDRVLAVLRSPAVRLWLRETGMPLRGGYLRMKTATLRTLPVAASAQELRRAYGLTPEQWSRSL